MISSTSFITTTILLLLYYTALLLHWRRRSHRNSSTTPPLPPGPTSLPIVGNLPFIEPDLRCFARLAAAYGPIYRLRLGAQLAIVVSSPSLAREILRDNDAVFANHDLSIAASIISFRRSDIVFSPYGSALRMLRRVFSQGLLSPANLAAVYHLRRREVRKAIRRVYSASAAGEAVDVGEEVTSTMLSVVTSMLWGGSEGNGEEEGTEEGVARKEFLVLTRRIAEVLGKPNLSDFSPLLRIFDIQGIKKNMRALKGRLEVVFDEKIERKRREMGKSETKENFLDFLLELEKIGYLDDGKTLFTMDHVKALLMDVIIGGTETISNTIEFTMAEMLNRPETLKRAQEELDEVVGKSSVVEESHAPKLRYLSAVMKEGLRLHPPLPLLVPRNPSSTCVIGGHCVPQGSKIFINISAIQRDAAVWEDATEFRPERFAQCCGSKRDFTGNDFSYMPFGSGRRICPGVPLAERNFTYCLASLLHSFDWKLKEGSKIDLKQRFGVVAKKAEPLVVVPVPRLSDPRLYAS